MVARSSETRDTVAAVAAVTGGVMRAGDIIRVRISQTVRYFAYERKLG